MSYNAKLTPLRTTKGKIYETMKSKLEEIKAQSPMEKVRIDKTPEILAVVAKLADLQLPEIYEFDDFINYLAHSNKYISTIMYMYRIYTQSAHLGQTA